MQLARRNSDCILLAQKIIESEKPSQLLPVVMARRGSILFVQSMKGLEQAVNIKLWPGNGESAKAWGKLKQVSQKKHDGHPKYPVAERAC